MRIRDWSSDVCSSDLHTSLALSWRDRCRCARCRPGSAMTWGQHRRRATAQTGISGAPSSYGLAVPSSAGFAARAKGGEMIVLCSWSNLRARSEEHTSELQSLMHISYAVFCLKKKKHKSRLLLKEQQNTKTEEYNKHTEAQS